MTPDNLVKICAHLSAAPHSDVFICILIFGLLAFLRRSNLVPPTVAGFNSKEHLCKGDVMNTEDGLIILLKWSKTVQCSERIVPLALIPGHPLCPVSAFNNMCQAVPSGTNQPLFLLRSLLDFVVQCPA